MAGCCDCGNYNPGSTKCEKIIEEQKNFLCCLFCFLARQPLVGHGLLIYEVSTSHTTTQHSRQDSSGLVISSSQRPLPDNTRHSQQTDIHAPRWDSNPRSQQASGHRSTPQTARTLGPAEELRRFSKTGVCCVELVGQLVSQSVTQVVR